MNDRDIMKQALDALKLIDEAMPFPVAKLTIKNLRERLAQPEQEPFCYHDGRNIVGKEYADHSDVFPLYTRPQAREPLTEKRINELYLFWIVDCQDVVGFARAIERAAHGITGEKK